VVDEGAEPEKEGEQGGPPEELMRLIETLKFEEIVVRVLHRQGLRQAELVPYGDVVRSPAYALWLPLLLYKNAKAAWVELRIEMERPPALALFKKIMGNEPGDDTDLLSTLREVMNLIQDTTWLDMDGHKDADLFIPMRPLALKADEIPRDIWSLNAQRAHYGIRLNEELNIRVTVTSQAAARKERLITWLKPLDVLAAPIETEEGRVLLLHRGIMLDESYIEKIQSIIYQYELETKVPVFRPPSGMAVFLDARHNAIITPNLTG
jgi:hypothetical protein